jgi:SET domain
LVNCFTLVSPCYDPLGIVLHPLAALANHSCDYNAVVRVEFHWPGGHRLKVRALRPIASGEEITVSYIDATTPRHVRQRELQDRYFFTCECSKCLDDTLVKKEDVPHPLDPEGHLAIEQRAFDLLAAARKDTSITGPVQKLKYGIHILRKSKAWPLHRQPLASLRQELVVSLIAASQLHHAFLHAWIQYRCVDQIIFPERNHPIRLVHQWLVAALIRRVDISKYGREDLPLQQYNIFNLQANLHRLFGYVLCNLRRKVKDDNFGDFAAMVRRTYFRHSGSLAGNPVGREEFLQEADKLRVCVKRVLKEELVWGDGS